MQSKRDLAIVLRSTPYEERHRIITALTEQNGVVSALAKNSIQSRRFGGTLEIFAASEWLFTQRPNSDLLLLSEAHIRNPFEGIRKDFERLSLASVLNELILKLAPQHQECSELFRLHSNALLVLSESPTIVPSGIHLLNTYLSKLLQWSGNQPRLSSCLQCGISLEEVKPHSELSCIIADAGWICSGCRTLETRHIREREGRNLQQSMLRLTPTVVRDFQLCLRTPIRQVHTQLKASYQEHLGLFRFLEALYLFHIPGFDKHPLKSLRFLGLESNGPPQAMNQR